MGRRMLGGHFGGGKMIMNETLAHSYMHPKSNFLCPKKLIKDCFSCEDAVFIIEVDFYYDMYQHTSQVMMSNLWKNLLVVFS